MKQSQMILHGISIKRVYVVSALVVASLAGILGVRLSAGSGAAGSAELLKTINQLIEQNRRLVDKNQELIEQIEPLQQAIGAVQTASSPIP